MVLNRRVENGGSQKVVSRSSSSSGKEYFRSQPKLINSETLEGGGVFLIPMQAQVCVNFFFSVL